MSVKTLFASICFFLISIITVAQAGGVNPPPPPIPPPPPGFPIDAYVYVLVVAALFFGVRKKLQNLRS